MFYINSLQSCVISSTSTICTLKGPPYQAVLQIKQKNRKNSICQSFNLNLQWGLFPTIVLLKYYSMLKQKEVRFQNPQGNKREINIFLYFLYLSHKSCCTCYLRFSEWIAPKSDSIKSVKHTLLNSCQRHHRYRNILPFNEVSTASYWDDQDK